MQVLPLKEHSILECSLYYLKGKGITTN